MNESARFDTLLVLQKALPVLEATHRVLANNVANANTPGFTPTRVSFEDSLRRALGENGFQVSLQLTHSKHMALETMRPELVPQVDSFEPGRNDQSEFNVDREMVELSRNSGRFEVLSAILTKKYQQMREVLRIP